MRGRDSRKAGGARKGGETRLAVATAGLYLIGAALIATSFLLPEVSSPAGAAAVAGTAVLTAVGLVLAVARARPGLTLAWLAELWGVAIIAVLCASTGGASSPFALLYFFAIGHAAAFQPRWRFELTAAVGLLAFLAPLVYSTVSPNFAAIALVGAVLLIQPMAHLDPVREIKVSLVSPPNPFLETALGSQTLVKAQRYFPTI